MKRGDRVCKHGVKATVIDVHPDRAHVSVLPDVSGDVGGHRALVRWRIPDAEPLL